MAVDGRGISERKFLYSLEGFRGIAALVVVIFHYAFSLDLSLTQTILLPRAYLTVDLFFVVSGFVIAHAYERDLLDGMSLRRFALRRVVRLWPLLVLSLALAVAVQFLAGLFDRPHLNRSLTLVSFFLSLPLLPTPEALSPSPDFAFPLNSPAWSLSVEMGANLAYAAMIGMLTSRRLALFAAASAVGLILVGVLGSNGLAVGSDLASYGGGWLRVGWGFFAGVLIHRFWLLRPPKPLPAFALHGLAIGFVGLAAMPRTFPGPLDLLAVLILFPLAVYFGAGVQISGFAKATASRLGQLSYAVYITHMPVMAAIKLLAGVSGLEMARSPLAALVLCSLLAIAIAWALDVVYDKPVRAYLTRKMAARARRSEAAAPAIAAGSA